MQRRATAGTPLRFLDTEEVTGSNLLTGVIIAISWFWRKGDSKWCEWRHSHISAAFIHWTVSCPPAIPADDDVSAGPAPGSADALASARSENPGRAGRQGQAMRLPRPRPWHQTSSGPSGIGEAEAEVTRRPLGEGSGKHGHLDVVVVVDLCRLLAGVGAQDASGVLDESTLEGDRAGEEQGVQCRAVEAFADEVACRDNEERRAGFGRDEALLSLPPADAPPSRL